MASTTNQTRFLKQNGEIIHIANVIVVFILLHFARNYFAANIKQAQPTNTFKKQFSSKVCILFRLHYELKYS